MKEAPKTEIDLAEAKKILDGNLSELDRDKMISLLENFTEKVKDSWRVGEEFLLTPQFSDFLSFSPARWKNILVLGMGGSAIGGDLLSGYLAEELPIPLMVICGYNLPRFGGEDSLVLAVSYSGNTEETISALQKSLEAKAKVIALTSGGKMAELATEYHFPLLKVPTGIQPRAALPYLFFPLLKVLEKIGLISKREEEIRELLDILPVLCREYGSGSPLEDNLAKKIAVSLYQYLPLVYGSEGLLEGVAKRWKTQINENSKWPCFWNVFSELNHNELVGYELENKINRQVKIVYLEDEEGPLRLKQRQEITQRIIGDKVAEFITCSTRGKGKLARLFSLIYLGDLVSYYLALMNRVDPSPVVSVEKLKRELAQLG